MNENSILQEKIENVIESKFNICNINVTVTGQSVTLNGLVNTDEEKEKVENIAWNTVGVISVNNLLAVKREE